MFWVPSLAHINTNTNAVALLNESSVLELHHAQHSCLRRPATLSKPNGLSDQQHSIRRGGRRGAFSVGHFVCQGAHVCHSLRNPVRTQGWLCVDTTVIMHIFFLILRLAFCSFVKMQNFASQRFSISKKNNELQYTLFKGDKFSPCEARLMGKSKGRRMCTKLMLIRDICTKELF